MFGRGGEVYGFGRLGRVRWVESVMDDEGGDGYMWGKGGGIGALG